MPKLSLFIDTQNRALVRGFSNTIGASIPPLYQGDTLELFLEFLNPTGDPTNSAPYADIDYSTATVQVGLGTIGAAPTAGGIFVTDSDTSTTTTGSPIPFNATSVQVQTALRTLAGWSTCVVTGPVAGPFVVTNGVSGAKALLQGSGSTFTPVSGLVGFTVQVGTVSLPAIQQIAFVQSPIAYQNSWTPAAGAGISITQTQAGGGGANCIQQILLTGNPYAGSFPLTLGGQTVTIYLSDSLATVQAKLQGLSTIGANNCSVGGTPGSLYTVTFVGALANTAQSLFTSNTAGLVVHPALTGVLALNTPGVDQAIGEQPSTTCTLEIKVTPSGGYPQVVLQVPGIQIINDLLQFTQTTPPVGDFTLTTTSGDARYLRQVNWLNGNPAALTPGAAGSASLARLALTNSQYIAPTAGSGAYTYTPTLSTTNAVRGDFYFVLISMPASTNPTVAVTGAATESIIGTGTAFKTLLMWIFNGTSWDLAFRSA